MFYIDYPKLFFLIVSFIRFLCNMFLTDPGCMHMHMGVGISDDSQVISEGEPKDLLNKDHFKNDKAPQEKAVAQERTYQNSAAGQSSRVRIPSSGWVLFTPVQDKLLGYDIYIEWALKWGWPISPEWSKNIAADEIAAVKKENGLNTINIAERFVKYREDCRQYRMTTLYNPEHRQKVADFYAEHSKKIADYNNNNNNNNN